MSDNDTDAREAAREYAWKWFEYHAGQRMTVFRFFLILTGALTAGCLTFLQQRRYGLLAFLSILLIIFAFLFWRLDRRNRELVKIGETYLQQEEGRLSAILRTEAVRLVTIVDQREWGRPAVPRFVEGLNERIRRFLGTYFKSFGQVYQWIFTIVALSALALLIYALITVLCGASDPISI